MPAPDRFIPFVFTNLAKHKAEISIRGVIGVPKAYAEYLSSGAGGTVMDFEKALKNLDPDVEVVTLRLFSKGGDIFTAMAMHDMIAAHPARFVALVDGLVASAATWLMNACDEIQMPANAWYFMHNVQSITVGDHRAMRKSADDAEKFTGDLARLYLGRMKKAGNKKSINDVRGMMDVETWLNGSEAKKQGLVDTVLGEIALSNSLDTLAALPVGEFAPVNLERVPAEMRPLFDTQRNPNPNNTSSIDMKPEEIQLLVTNGIKEGLKAHADETTTALNSLRDGVKNEVAAAIKPEIENAIKPINEAVSKLNTLPDDFKSLAARLEKAENLLKSGVAGAAGGTNGLNNTEGEGENAADKLAALREKLNKETDPRERGRLVNQISELKKAS